MTKKLITPDNLENFCTDGTLYVEPGYILTPGAIDKARLDNITIHHGKPHPKEPPALSEAGPSPSDQHAGHDFIMPTINLLGSGCLTRAIGKIKAMDCSKALVVTDAILCKVGVATIVTDMLFQHGIDAVIYDGTCPNPSVANVQSGLGLLRKNRCDFVISLGGGSPHDCAKAIALLATNGGDISDYVGIDRSHSPSLPLVAINTTAGTASEMTRFCIITNEQTHVKMAIVDQNVTPAISINDPQLMLGMPASLTAATGMDALTHAIEAYISTQATPLTDAVASKAMELIVKYLPRAVENGQDEEAREQMAYAQFMAGMAFNNAGLGYVHAMAHQLGGKYGLPHGICNAVLLPYVMAYNMETAADRLSDVAYFLGCRVHGKPAREASVMGIEEVCRLLLKVNIPTSLTALNVSEADIPFMAANALKDACALTNPRQGTQADIEQIFRNAL